ncbi:MAG: hypothetical protein ACE5WD_03605 [Candidatus Aminicenantia bacterium]
MKKRRLKRKAILEIGGIVISISSDDYKLGVEENNAFLIHKSKINPDVKLRTHYRTTIDCHWSETIFEAGNLWSMHRYLGKVIFSFPSQSSGQPLHRVANLASDFRTGDIFITAKETYQNSLLTPLEYPLDELLIINILSLGRGILVHACGVGDGEKGYLFAGSSKAGKSTVANLWKSKKDVTILSDDRIIIRKINGCFWIYGTPWHGDAKANSPEKALLNKIFFLKHAKRNIVRKIHPVEATSRLIICSFPPFWDKNGMEFTLKLCAELVQKIPCYELSFAPDESVLDLVQRYK